MNKTIFLMLVLGLPFTAFADVTYTVRKGDTLLKIADRQLGISDKKDPRRHQLARRIQAQNPQIKNPNVLEPGDVLTLPGDERPAPKPAVNAPPKPLPVAAPVPPPAPAPVAPTKPPIPPGPAVPPPHANHPPVPPPHEHAPAPATEPAPHADAHPDFIGVQPRFQMLTLDVTDEATHATAKLKSKSSIGIDLQYGKILSEKSHFLAQIGYTKTEFNPIESSTAASVDHSSEAQRFFALGFAYEITHSLHFDAFINTADRTFVIPAVGNAYAMKSLMIPGAEVNFSWDFVQAPSYVLGASVIGEYIASLKKDDVEYKSSLEPLGALYWTSKRGHDRLNYRVNLIYKKGHQHTSVSEQKEEAAILGFMIYFPLGH